MPRLHLRDTRRREARAIDAPCLSHPDTPQKRADADETMNVLLLTVFIGVVLVLFFVAMFLREVADPRGASERDALLPLAVEKPHRTAAKPQDVTSAPSRLL